MKKCAASLVIFTLTSVPASAANNTFHCTFGIVPKNIEIDFDKSLVKDLDQGVVYHARISTNNIAWSWTMGDRRGSTAIVDRFTGEASNIFRFGDENTGRKIEPWNGRCTPGGPVIGPR